MDVLLLDHLTTTWQAAARPSRDGRFLAAVGRAALLWTRPSTCSG